MSKQIQKKHPLSGKLPIPKAKDGGPNAFKRKKYNAVSDLRKHGLVAVEEIEFTNPITNEKKMVTLRRDGTNEARLIEALADPKMPREQKNVVLSMYLFEEGLESASLLMDLWAHKGEHTKQTNHFKAQVRRDVDIMVDTFALFMRDAADRIFQGLQFEVRTVKEGGKEKQVLHRLAKSVPAIEIENIVSTLGDVAFYFQQTADLMALRMREETERREKEMGKGIYVDVKGGVYSVYEDGDIVDRVEADIHNINAKKDGKKK
jgi:hypothetical protein